MLGPFVVQRTLSNGRGRVQIDAYGMLLVQQGRPFGVIAVPGEAHLLPEDVNMILEMYQEFFALGYRVAPKGTIRPL